MAQEAGNARPSEPVDSSEAAGAKAQKGGLSMPGSAFKSLKSMSFKRRQSQGVCADRTGHTLCGIMYCSGGQDRTGYDMRGIPGLQHRTWVHA